MMPNGDPLTTIYFGEMHYLPETDEFYTPAYMNPDLEDQSANSFISLLDSTVVSTGGVIRKRLPMKDAKSLFLLYDIDSLYVYNTNNEFISRVSLKRVEWMKDQNTEQFIVVYEGEPLNADPADVYYCMSDTLHSLLVPDFSYKTLNDPSLNTFLLHQLNLEGNNREIKNIELQPSGAVYSVITSANQSLITELKDGHVSMLKDMNAKNRVDHILPLPYEVNGKPLLLASLYIPGEKVRPASLAVFADFQEYEVLRYNRLQLKKKKHVVDFRFSE